jgi:hypothetical protein
MPKAVADAMMSERIYFIARNVTVRSLLLPTHYFINVWRGVNVSFRQIREVINARQINTFKHDCGEWRGIL